MPNFGAKTPVSGLQEYLVGKKMIPHYELIYNGVGTRNPKFTFRVQVGALSEEGSGRSKQEAKHQAAEKMLKTLVGANNETEAEEKNEFNTKIEENFVGELKDFCYLQHYPDPKYYLEEAAGPPHSRIFKMICCVSQVQDFGISTTKKQAKQQAAQKMIQHLKKIGNKRIREDLYYGDIQTEQIRSEPLSNEIIMEKYNTLKTKNPVARDPVVFYRDHHLAYNGLQEKSAALKKVIKENSLVDLESSLNLLEEIAKDLEVTLTEKEIPSKENSTSYIIMTMFIFPPIAAAGTSKKDAALNLLNSLLFLVKTDF